MEIRTYLGIISRYWWMIVLVVLAAMGTVALLDRVKTPFYSAQARVVVQPIQNLTDQRTLVDLIGQLDNLSIANTLAQTFTSADVKANTLKALNISNNQLKDYTLIANRLPDTIIIEVSGTGPDPNFLAKYINATATATITDSRKLFQVAELSMLEPASVPSQPSSPMPARDIPTAAALGLLIGIMLVLLIDYLRDAPIPITRSRTTDRARTPGTANLGNTGGTSTPPYANWTQSVDVIEGPTLVGKDNQKPATDPSWLPAPRQHRPQARRNRG